MVALPWQLDPTLDPLTVPPPVSQPQTGIYSGGTIPGQGAPSTPADPSVATAALSRLQIAYKQRTGQDLTPEVQTRLLRGETLSPPSVPGGVRVSPPPTPGTTEPPSSLSFQAPSAQPPPPAPPPPTPPPFLPRGLRSLAGQSTDITRSATEASNADLAAKQQIAKGELELKRVEEARLAREQLTTATGYIAGGGRIFARDIGVDVTGIYKADPKTGLVQLDANGKPVVASIDRWNAAQEQLQEALGAAGMEVTPANITALLMGQSVQPPARLTIDAQVKLAGIAHDTARIQLAGREVTVGEQKAAWDQIMDRAKATGDFTDPKTGLTTQTLDKWQVQLQAGALTGYYQGAPTLQNKMQTWNQESQDKAVFGFDRKNADGSTSHVYGTNELPYLLQKDKQQYDQMLLAGFDYVDPETGESRHIKGQQELITDERQYAERVRTGYDETITGPDGKPVRDAKGNLITKHIEGTQELQSRIADRTAALQEKGMNLDAAHQQAVLEWDQRKYTGFYQARTVSLKDLGLDSVIPVEARGSTDAFMRWADHPENAASYQRLEAALGHRPTAIEFGQLIAGENVALTRAVSTVVNGQTVTTYEPIVDHIEGEMGLEQSRQQMARELQENGFTHDDAVRQADQAYQDKVRNGYFTVDEMGHRVRVRGSQEDQEYLTRLTAELNGDRDAAQRQFDEEQRVGYDKIVDGRRVHIEGAQEAAKADADRVDKLTRNGWSAEAANQRARDERAEKVRIGYFQGRYDQATGKYVTEWVPGTGLYSGPDTGGRPVSMEEHLQTLANNHMTTIENARLAASAAENQKNRIHDQWIQDRGWYYEQMNMNRADARQKAEQDWQTGERVLDRTLQTNLEQMNLTASENRLEAEGRMQMLQTSIGALATIGAGVGGFIARNGLSGLWDAITNGRTSRADLVKIGTDAGMTKAQAEAWAGTTIAGITSTAGTTVESESMGAGIDPATGLPRAAFISDATGKSLGLPAGWTAKDAAGNATTTVNPNVATTIFDDSGRARYTMLKGVKIYTAGETTVGANGLEWTPGLSGSGLTGNAAVFANAVAPMAAIVYAIYAGSQIYADFRRQQALEGQVDDWWQQVVPPGERADFRGIVKDEHVDWGDKRGHLFDVMTKLMNEQAKGRDIGGYLDPVTLQNTDIGHFVDAKDRQTATRVLLRYQDLQSKDTVRLQSAARLLVDRGGLKPEFDPGKNLTVKDRDWLTKNWDLLPQEFRKATENAPFKDKLADLQNYASVGQVRSSEQLVADINSTLQAVGPKVAYMKSHGVESAISYPDNNKTGRITTYDGSALSLDEANAIQQLWVQRGGDPRVDLGTEAVNLSVDFDTVKSVSAQWVQDHVTNYLVKK